MKLRKLVCAVVWVLACVINHGCSEKKAGPKNIILFIGDGMGISQITAGKITNGSLNLERFKAVGLLTTHAQDNLVTDSAASATAMATGHKTYNQAIAVDIDSTTALKTSFEYAAEKGMATGIICTCTVTHATPACFLAHVDLRKKHSEIAEQIANSNVNVLIGAGWAYFVPDSVAGSERHDSKNPLAVLEKKMTVVRSLEALRSTKNVNRMAAFIEPIELPKAQHRDYGLAELTAKGLEVLSQNQKGFILMVEGSQIDWAGHNNDSENIIHEMIDFDGAVGVGLDYAEKHPETLVLVTADHETGGFAIHDGSMLERKVTETGFTHGGHTATMVPIFAFGPQEEAFCGIQDNTAVGKRIIEFVQAHR